MGNLAEIKERPILFSAPMVRTILDGRKTQTRRVVKPQPIDGDALEVGSYAPTVVDRHGEGQPGPEGWGASSEYECIRCPYGKPGDRLWVKEAYYAWGKWVPNGTTRGGRKAWRFMQVGTSLRYLDGNKPSKTAKRDGECGWVYRHGRFMPKRHSRITLEITEVRVQRLQEIRNSQEDVIAEGISEQDVADSDSFYAWGAYRQLWESINGKGSWNANPWVWALTFRRVL